MKKVIKFSLGLTIFILCFTILAVDKTSAGTEVVSGTVNDITAGTPGTGLAGIEIWCYTVDFAKWEIATTDGSGAFSINEDDFLVSDEPRETTAALEVDEWVNLEARVPDGYNGVLNQIGFTWDGATYDESPVDFQLLNAPKIVSGTVTYSDSGTPISGVYVVAYPLGMGGVGSVGDHSDDSGVYTINLRSGVPSWSVQAVVDLGTHNINWLPTGSPINVSFENNADPETETLDFTVETTTASVTVKFLDADGNILRDDLTGFRADCSLFRSDGIGTIRKVDASSNLTGIGLPAGIYNYWCYHNNLSSQSFPNNTFTLSPGEIKDLGTIQAEVDNATISGIVTNAETGQPIANKQITCSSQNNPKFLTDDTDSDGNYSFTVGTGVWNIGLNNMDNQYMMVAPLTVNVTENGATYSDNDIQLAETSLQISGDIIQGLGGDIFTSYPGFVYAKTSDGNFYSDTAENGQYAINLPASYINSTVTMGAVGDVNATYGLASEVEVQLPGNTTQDLTLVANNATITGTLKGITGNTIQPVANEISIMAIDNMGNIRKVYAGTDGSYSLPVVAGVWNLGFKIEASDSNYLNQPVHVNLVEVASGETAEKDLTVRVKDAVISGAVVNSADEGVALAPVYVTNLPILKATGEVDPAEVVELSTNADADGNYSLAVPAGTYLVFTGLTPDIEATDFEPNAQNVTVAATETATADLAFVTYDAVLAGLLYDPDGEAVDSGTVAAYTDDGGFAEAQVSSSGPYSLNVKSGQTWNLLATYLSGSDLYIAEGVSITPGSGENTQHLTLTDSGINVPGAMSQSFDADDFITLSLPNGGSVQFSPYAIDSTGTVSVSIEPRIDLSPSAVGSPVTIGYDIKARNDSDVEVTRLANPVKIILPYSESFLTAHGILETSVVPQFFAKIEGHWTSSGLVTMLDTTTNQVVICSDHLTRFLINGAVTEEIAEEPIDLTITSVAPATVYSNQPHTIAITGTGFETSDMSLALIKSNGTEATGLTLTVSSTTEASFTIPGDYYADAYDVKLTRSSDETTTIKENAFIVKEAKNVIVVTPAAGGGPHVRLMLPDGTLRAQFFAYNQSLRAGFFTAMGDLDGDGAQEVIVAPGRGLSPEVRVFSQAGTQLYSFYAYDQNFRGGVSVAAGDVDNDGKDEIVTLPFSDGGSNTRIFGLRSGSIVATTENFFIFEQALRGGFSLVMPDLEGDGKAEIVVAPVSAGSAHIQIFGYRALEQRYRAVILGLIVYDQAFHGGITLGGGDLDGDGDDEIITGTYSHGGPHIMSLYRKSEDQMVHKLNPGWFAFDPNFHGGVNVSTVDAESDGASEIVVAVRSSSAPLVRTFVPDGSLIKHHFYAFAQTYLGGVNVSSGVYLP